MWTKMNATNIPENQLSNQKQATDFLRENWEEKHPESDELIKIKTGLFIQSMKFDNTHDVEITGYLWQNYDKGQMETLGLDSTDVGFIFPEQVDSGSSIEPKEINRTTDEDGNQVVCWYFETILRQPFDYRQYPFDQQSVWMRMWPKNFTRNVVLIPDYDSYLSTDVTNIFGVEENIVLGDWQLNNTFFDYKLSSYDADFGIVDYFGQKEFPELHFNLFVKRKVANSFFVYVLPLLLAASLLFALLLTVIRDEKKSAEIGYSMNGFIGTSSALLFVVFFAHSNLRQEFQGTTLVYLDFFYIIMYIYMILLNINVYIFTVKSATWLTFIHYKDNLIPKILYWPVLLLSLVLATIPYL